MPDVPGARTAIIADSRKQELNDQRSDIDDDELPPPPPPPGHTVHTCTDCMWIPVFIVAMYFWVKISFEAHNIHIDHDDAEFARQALKTGNHSTAIQDLQDVEAGIILFTRIVQRDWIIIALSCTFAMLTGVFYSRFLYLCVDFIMIMISLLLVSVPLVIGGVLALGIVPVSGPVPDLNTQSNRTYAGYGLIAFSMLMGMVVCRLQAVMEAAAASIKASTECMINQSSLTLEPFIVTVLRLIVLLVALPTLAKLLTSGGISKDGELNPDTPRKMGYVIFSSWWLLSLSSCLSEYVASWVTQRWYFTPYVDGVKLDVPKGIHIGGYGYALGKHIGSLIFGSLFIPIVRPARFVLGLVHSSAQSTTPCGACVSACCCCCLRVFNCCLRPVSKHAFIKQASSSESFCRSGRSYNEVVDHHAHFLKGAHGMQELFMIGGLVLITFASTLLSMMSAKTLKSHGWEDLNLEVGSVVAVLTSLSVGTSFTIVFDMVADTIMYCYMLQEWRRDFRVNKCKFPSHPSNKSYVGWLLTDSLRADESRINYAPPALREFLAKQRQFSQRQVT